MQIELSQTYHSEDFGDVVRFSQPWEHFVLDGLIETRTFLSLQESILKGDSNYQMEAEDPAQLQFRLLPNFQLAEFFLSGDFKLFLEKLTKTRIALNKNGAIQLRRMTPKSPEFYSHHDFSGIASIAMLYYISPGWASRYGGELLLHKEQNSSPTGCDTKWIAPIPNRLVLFKTDETNWHSVRRVREWNRHVIVAEWLITKDGAEDAL